MWFLIWTLFWRWFYVWNSFAICSKGYYKSHKMFNLTFSSFNAKETSKTFGGFSLKEIEIGWWKWKCMKMNISSHFILPIRNSHKESGCKDWMKIERKVNWSERSYIKIKYNRRTDKKIFTENVVCCSKKCILWSIDQGKAN